MAVAFLVLFALPGVASAADWSGGGEPDEGSEVSEALVFAIDYVDYLSCDIAPTPACGTSNTLRVATDAINEVYEENIQPVLEALYPDLFDPC